jgi:hypothetical protein
MYVDGAAGNEREGKCSFHVDACFRIDKAHGNIVNKEEVDSGGDLLLVNTLSHIYTDESNSTGYPEFSICEVCVLKC